jgi:hypothetical protein
VGEGGTMGLVPWCEDRKCVLSTVLLHYTGVINEWNGFLLEEIMPVRLFVSLYLN